MKFISGIKIFLARHTKLRFALKFLFWFFVIIAAMAILTFAGLEVSCRPKAGPLPSTVNKSQLPIENLRPEVSTYLTYPEWFIVYSSDEYAQFLEKNRPSHFPYFGSIGQYWGSYCRVYALTKAKGEFSAGDHLMLFVIGWSYTGEYIIKGVYENTIGRITEFFGNYPATTEDAYADKVAKDYVVFIRLRPWYEYNFAGAFVHLWTDNNFFGKHFVRKLERRLFLSLEYGVKTIYGQLIGFASHSVYGVESVDTYVIANNVPDSVFTAYPEITKVKQLGPGKFIIIIPRYQPFTELVPMFAGMGVKFEEISGNKEIFLTVLLPRNISYVPPEGQVIFQTNILTNPNQKRIGLSVPVGYLHQVLLEILKNNGFIEHIYDY